MRKVILFVLVVGIIIGGMYAYKLYTGKVESLESLKADFALPVAGLITAFEKDSVAANRLYLGKVIEVKGGIKKIEQESGTLVLGEENSLSSVRCSLDSNYVKRMSDLNVKALITVKGACTGFNADEMGLGADVVLNRCVFVSENK